MTYAVMTHLHSNNFTHAGRLCAHLVAVKGKGEGKGWVPGVHHVLARRVLPKLLQARQEADHGPARVWGRSR